MGVQLRIGTQTTIAMVRDTLSTVVPPNNGHVGDECFIDYSEVVPSLEVLSCIQLLAGGTQCVHCREVLGVSTMGGSTVAHTIL